MNSLNEADPMKAFDLIEVEGPSALDFESMSLSPGVAARLNSMRKREGRKKVFVASLPFPGAGMLR